MLVVVVPSERADTLLCISTAELDRKDIDPKQRQYLQRLEARKKG